MTKRERNEKTRIVFTTEWQSVPLNLDRNTFILVDEASKSPMFHAFTPIARELLREKTLDLYGLRLRGLTVIGDIQQAITLEPEYSSLKGRELLLLPYIEHSIQSVCRSGIVENCEEYILMLQETLRLPRFSEDPISQGYYRGLLKAVHTLGDKLDRSMLSLCTECIDEAYNAINKSLGSYLTPKLNRVLLEYVKHLRI